MSVEQILERRQKIEQLLGENMSQAEIARQLHEDPATVCRDIKALTLKREQESLPIPAHSSNSINS